MDDIVRRQSEIRRKLNANGRIAFVSPVEGAAKNNAATVSDRGIPDLSWRSYVTARDGNFRH